MKKKESRRVAIAAFFFFLILTLFVGSCMYSRFQNAEETYRTVRQNAILKLNEIENLTQIEGKSPVSQQIYELQEELRGMEMEKDTRWDNSILVMYFACVLFLIVLLLYLYCMILRPFEKLQHYAAEIAKGNFSESLNFERQNMFGAFTWAFDHMRREIIKARRCEQEAILNNKTVIATLSHDIKTPIASIRAYAEGLEANIGASAQRRQRYIAVIMKKCDQVTALTNDLFLHSLSDMDKLKITKRPTEISELLKLTISEIAGEHHEIFFLEKPKPCVLAIDERRFAQVLENIIANARKYAAGTKITIGTRTLEEAYEIHICDHGAGILPEDMPFIFDKFYRGKNVLNEKGAGLGLYIVKYIMEQMDGSVQLVNRKDGLEVVLTLPIRVDCFLEP